MIFQALCAEKGLISLLGVFGYVESENQYWQAEKCRFHYLICIFPRWPPKKKAIHVSVNELLFRMTLSPKLGVVGISTLWHFRLPLPIQMFIKDAKLVQIVKKKTPILCIETSQFTFTSQ